METVRPADLDASAAEELALLRNRATALDAPHALPETAETLRLVLALGWDGEGSERVLLARDEDGTLLGYAALEMPTRDNRTLLWLDLVVDPARRHHGVGSALLAAATEVSGEVGRDLQMTSAWWGSPGPAFCKRHGFTQGSSAAQRRLYPQRLPREGDDALLTGAQTASAGYRVLRVRGALEEDLRARMLDTVATINDAPLDDLEVEDNAFSDERLRLYDETQQLQEHRLYRMIALGGDDEPAGHTVVAVDGHRPFHAEQHDTTVRREHRGHRLGLRLKLEMLAWLREEEPQLTQIDTWNMESNNHMVAVNDAIGCSVVGRELEFQRRV